MKLAIMYQKVEVFSTMQGIGLAQETTPSFEANMLLRAIILCSKVGKIT